MTSYRCYDALINDNVQWLSQSYGHTRAIGFKPRPSCQDFKSSLSKIITLFANFDPPARDAWNEYPAAPRLCRYYDTVYVNMDDERLRATLVNYFTANLPREMGRVVETPAEDGPDIDYVYDEDEVAQVAANLAARFMDTIEVSCFLRDDSIVSHPEYSIGLTRLQPSAVCS
jgi:hypothetical protein